MKKDYLKIAGKKLIQKGPKTVVIKKGAKGSMICGEITMDNIPVFPGIDVIDPTGAGDSFAGGFCGYIAKFGTKNLIDAILFGSAIASFTVSQFSVDGLREINMSDIKKRVDVISHLLSDKISIDWKENKFWFMMFCFLNGQEKNKNQ